MQQSHGSTREKAYTLPPVGGNPSSTGQGTTPGSFALRFEPGSPASFSSPDTPGMPQPSEKTAWDFMPADWTMVPGSGGRTWRAPEGFVPVTQLEYARLGEITPEMRRVAEREPHLTPEMVRDEVAAGRMVIPANKVHLGYQLDPMCIGRASRTKVNANMGASPIALLRRGGRKAALGRALGRRHRDGSLHRRRSRRVPSRRSCKTPRVPIGTVPIYSMIIGRKIEELDAEDGAAGAGSIRRARASTISPSTPACCASTCRSSSGA